MNRYLRWTAGLGLTASSLLLARRCCTVATVRGTSMLPTLQDGRRVLAVRWPRYRVGDIIVFWTPGGSGTPADPDYRIKRVIATGGQPRPAALENSTLAAVVPRGHLAVAGDNVARSQDSRQLGYIRRAEVLGRLLAQPRPWSPGGPVQPDQPVR